VSLTAIQTELREKIRSDEGNLMIQDDSEMTPIGTNSRKLDMEEMDSSEKTTAQEDLLLVTN
jgi:hypothetical protein